MAVCDICGAPGWGTKVMSDQMCVAMRNGFDPFRLGLTRLPPQLVKDPGFLETWKRNSFQQWQQTVMSDSSGWNCCADCMPTLNPFFDDNDDNGSGEDDNHEDLSTDGNLIEVYSGTECRELERIQSALEAEGLHPSVENTSERDRMMLPGVPLAPTFSVFVEATEVDAAVLVVDANMAARSQPPNSNSIDGPNIEHTVTLDDPDIDIVERWQRMEQDEFERLKRGDLREDLQASFDAEVARRRGNPGPLYKDTPRAIAPSKPSRFGEWLEETLLGAFRIVMTMAIMSLLGSFGSPILVIAYFVGWAPNLWNMAGCTLAAIPMLVVFPIHALIELVRVIFGARPTYDNWGYAVVHWMERKHSFNPFAPEKTPRPVAPAPDRSVTETEDSDTQPAADMKEGGCMVDSVDKSEQGQDAEEQSEQEVQKLLKHLLDEGCGWSGIDPSMRAYAATRLGEYGNPRAIEPLTRALGARDEEVRRSAAEALAQLGQPEWRQWVQGDDDDFARLGASNDARAATALIWTLGYGRSESDDAATALVSLGESAVDPLMNALRDKLAETRSSAARSLGKIGDVRAVQPLIAALGDSDPFVGRSIAYALSKLGNEAVDSLMDALSSSNWRVVEDAAFGLAESGDVRAVAPLVALLRYPEPYVRCAVAFALGQLGDRRAIAHLRAASGDQDPSVDQEISNAIKKLEAIVPSGAESAADSMSEQNESDSNQAPIEAAGAYVPPLEVVVSQALTTIQAHFERMKIVGNDRIMAGDLDKVLDHRDMIASIVQEKTHQCLQDGRGHSKFFMETPGSPMVSVSCWNCSLLELRARFERELYVPYAEALPSYLRKAQEIGASCYVHIFVCFTQSGLGVTCCYADMRSGQGRVFKPDELM